LPRGETKDISIEKIREKSKIGGKSANQQNSVIQGLTESTNLLGRTLFIRHANTKKEHQLPDSRALLGKMMINAHKKEKKSKKSKNPLDEKISNLYR
jgi:hypothetical protein